VLEQLGADLDHNIEVAHIQRRLPSEPDLDVTGLHRPSRGFFRTFDRFANNIWQQLTQAMQDLLAHLLVVGHIDQRHADQFPQGASSLQHLPSDLEVLAFEAGCEDYYEREVDEVEWQGGRVHLHLGARRDDPPRG